MVDSETNEETADTAATGGANGGGGVVSLASTRVSMFCSNSSMAERLRL